MTGNPRTRERILAAAERLLAERGPVSMGAIAQAAGVSRQALYLHFDDRAELLLATVDHIDSSGPLAELRRWVSEAPDGLTAVARFVELHAEYSPHIIEVARTIDAGRLTDPDLEAAWSDRMEGRRNACGRLIRWVAEDGALDPCWSPDGATDYLWSQTSLRVWDDLVNARGWSRDRYVTTMQRTVRRALAGP
ncbi:MAG: TetR family transcriptional regulator [Nitriliruptorales bacterium]|nr:TetR family transcriptional regulator [Nitriliruptorales bacterium]